MRRLWLLLAALPICAADSHPVGIVLAANGNAEYRRAGTDSWLTAGEGMVFSAGDSLRATSGTIRFAFCPGKTAATLSAGKTLLVPASDLGAEASDRAPVPSCEIPAVPETSGVMARGNGGPASAMPDCNEQKPDLLGALADVANAAKGGDNLKEIATLGKISCYPHATWTRGVVAHLSTTPITTTHETGPGETYALLVGISDYPAETKQGKLQYAHVDAETFAKFLRARRGGAIPDSHIRLLTNKDATLAHIEEAISTFVRDARGPTNTLIILLAGHGDYLPTKIDPATGKEIETAPFFITYDSYNQDQKTTGLKMSRFQEIIAEEALSFKRVFAFVDVCHAGHVQETSDKELPDAVRKVFNDNQGALGLMMAAGSRGVAYESDKFGGGHGAFTYAVLEGLNGKVEPNQQHEIVYDDLSGYVNNRVRELTDNAQKPTDLETRYDPVIFENAVAQPTIDLGPATKMAKEETGRRERGRPEPQRATVDQPPPIAEPDDARVNAEDRGQQILIRYLRGEQNAMVKADFEQCAGYFETAWRLQPANAFDESRMLFCQGRAAIFDRTAQAYAAGMGLLERSILLDPERGYAYNALGIAYLEQARGDANNYARAIAAFRDAIRFAPQWAYPLHNLALTYSEQGNFLAASRAYQQAMTLAPDYSYLPYNLGLLNQNVNRLDEAERYYRQAIAAAQKARDSGIEPKAENWRERAVIWNALATVEMARKRYKQAREDLMLSKADDPELGVWKHNQALLLTRKGPSAEAERLWREAIAVDPPGYASRIALMEYLLRNGRDADARAEFESLVGSLGLPGGGTPKLEELRNHLPFDAELFELYGDEAAQKGHAEDARAGYAAAESAYRTKQDRARVEKKAGW
jgi:tetratricopeptide (TPR) repeat protein